MVGAALLCVQLQNVYYSHCLHTGHQLSKGNDFLVYAKYPCSDVCVMVMREVIYCKNRSILFRRTSLWPAWWISLLNNYVKSHISAVVVFFIVLALILPNYVVVDIKQRQLSIRDHKLSSKIHHMSIEKGSD